MGDYNGENTIQEDMEFICRADQKFLKSNKHPWCGISSNNVTNNLIILIF